jgi:hypothetical protein
VNNVGKLMKLYAELRGTGISERNVVYIAKAAAWMDAIDAVADSGAPIVILDRATTEIEAMSAGLAGELASNYAYSRLGDLGTPLTDCRFSATPIFGKDGTVK